MVKRCLTKDYLVQGKYEEGYGTVLDSGTTFTYLPSDAFAAFRDKVSAFATAKGLHSVKGPDPKFHDICFGGAPHVDHPDQLSSVFPSLELKFAQVWEAISIASIFPSGMQAHNTSNMCSSR